MAQNGFWHWLKDLRRGPTDAEKAPGFVSSASPNVPTSPISARPPNPIPSIQVNLPDELSFVPRDIAFKWLVLTRDPEWGFHHAVSKRGSGHMLGYFHHVGFRLTTDNDISKLKLEELMELMEPFRKMPRYDEYTETVMVTRKRYGLKDPETPDESDREFYFVDHFNRRVLTQAQFADPAPLLNEPHETMASADQPYRSWMKSVTSEDSHYYKPSSNERNEKNETNKKKEKKEKKPEACLGRKIAQQIVWDYQTTHVTKDADIEGSFNISDCSSLLSALQKQRVTDKQCQKMIKAVIQRFLHVDVAKYQPKLERNFDPKEKLNEAGSFLTIAWMGLSFLVWVGPLLHVPFSYQRRMRLLAKRADDGEYVPDLWTAFIKELLKEWNDLNIVLALILSANVGFLALPGTSGTPPDGKPHALSDVSRAAALVSMFMTMSGLLTSLSLIWFHGPLTATGTREAYQYIIGSQYKHSTDRRANDHLANHSSFIQLMWMASHLGMPLVLLLWSVMAFVVSAVTWIFLYSATSTQATTATICAFVLLSPLVTIAVFRGPTAPGDRFLKRVLHRRSDQ